MPADGFQSPGYAEIVARLLGEGARGEGGRPALSDGSVGSVVRTLAEVFARELAVAYAQLDIVHKAAFLETAEGAALDGVVALLGLERLREGGLVGFVEFSRAAAAEADIAIPAGTLVAGPPNAGKPVPVFATLRDAVLPRGDREARVEVRSVDAAPKEDSVAAGALALMPRPVAGIERVGNATALTRRRRPEDDAALRDRARRALRRSRTGTAAGIEAAVRAAGVESVSVVEDLAGAPGEVSVVVPEDLAPEALEAVRDAVEAARPAGVRALVSVAIPILLRVEASLDLARAVPPEERAQLREAAKRRLAAFVAGLAPGEPLRRDKLLAALADDPRIAAAAAQEGAAGGGPVIAARALRGPGDEPPRPEAAGLIACTPGERFRLDPDPAWPKLEPRLPGARLDADLALAPTGERAAAERGATDALAARLRQLAEEQARKPGERVALTRAALLAALERVPGLDPARHVFDLVHERDGRVASLADGRAAEDSLEPGERLRLGTVRVGGGG